MNYSVAWGESAEAGFLASMLRAVDKPAMWAIAHSIDESLRSNPQHAGESREAPWRLLFVRPFSVLYYVEEETRTVFVEQIKWVGQ